MRFAKFWLSQFVIYTLLSKRPSKSTIWGTEVSQAAAPRPFDSSTISLLNLRSREVEKCLSKIIFYSVVARRKIQFEIEEVESDPKTRFRYKRTTTGVVDDASR